MNLVFHVVFKSYKKFSSCVKHHRFKECVVYLNPIRTISSNLNPNFTESISIYIMNMYCIPVWRYYVHYLYNFITRVFTPFQCVPLGQRTDPQIVLCHPEMRCLSTSFSEAATSRISMSVSHLSLNHHYSSHRYHKIPL